MSALVLLSIYIYDNITRCCYAAAGESTKAVTGVMSTVISLDVQELTSTFGFIFGLSLKVCE